MSSPIIEVSGVGKRYALGEIGAGTLRDSVERWVNRGKSWVHRCRPVPGVVYPTTPQPDNRTTDFPRELWALRDVSFSVRPGEVLGIIGRNGAGKSTLLKILSRVTESTVGRITLRGRVASLLEVGTGFHPELSGRENIYLNGAILGMKKAEIARKFDEIVAFAEVERFIDTPVKRYSSGMYVRLAFAVAAHLEPEILIVDEVLAVGDAAFQKRCLGKMGDVAKAGRTILFVSHNMDAIINLCPRALLIDKGTVVVDGPVAKTVEHYLGGMARQEGGTVDLRTHPGRPAGMSTILQAVALRTGPTGPVSDRVRTDDDLVVEIHYDAANGSLDLVQVGFCSVTGQRLFTVGTQFARGFDHVLLGKGVVLCRVGALPLAGGEYSLVVMIGKNNPPRNLDCVHQAISFHVDTADFFGTGRALLAGQGFFAVKSEWFLLQSQPT